MPGIDKAVGRVVALIVLLVLAVAALRGYLPAAERTQHHQPPDNPAAMAVTVALLGASLGIVAIAIITRLRNRRVVAGGIGGFSIGRPGGRDRPDWRVVLIGLAVVAAVLLVFWGLTRLAGQHGLVPLDRVPKARTGAPGPGGVAPPDTAPRPDWLPRKAGGNVFGYLAATSVGMLALIVIGAVLAAHGRRTHPAKSVPTPDGQKPIEPVVGAAEALIRAAGRGLTEISDPARDPRQAIIGCYAVMERELANVPNAVPQDFDTPTEVLTRAVEHHALPAVNATKLVRLFTEARFSGHLMTEQHREDAIEILRLVLAELRHRT